MVIAIDALLDILTSYKEQGQKYISMEDIKDFSSIHSERECNTLNYFGIPTRYLPKLLKECEKSECKHLSEYIEKNYIFADDAGKLIYGSEVVKWYMNISQETDSESSALFNLRANIAANSEMEMLRKTKLDIVKYLYTFYIVKDEHFYKDELVVCISHGFDVNTALTKANNFRKSNLLEFSNSLINDFELFLANEQFKENKTNENALDVIYTYANAVDILPSKGDAVDVIHNSIPRSTLSKYSNNKHLACAEFISSQF